MALLNDDLSVWEIAFRWEGHDPEKLWFCIPLLVRDRFRTLMDAILNARLDCETMSMNKWNPDEGFPPEYYIRHYLPQIENCIHGKKHDRKMLKWARVGQYDLKRWCERQGVPRPEFWFPPGWKEEFDWTSEEEKAQAAADAPVSETPSQKKIRIDDNHRAKMACQQMALIIWNKEPTLNANAVAYRKEVQAMLNGLDRTFETVLEWVREIDPRNPATKRGPNKRSNSAPRKPPEP